jgi:hypothetical protein
MIASRPVSALERMAKLGGKVREPGRRAALNHGRGSPAGRAPSVQLPQRVAELDDEVPASAPRHHLPGGDDGLALLGLVPEDQAHIFRRNLDIDSGRKTLLFRRLDYRRRHPEDRHAFLPSHLAPDGDGFFPSDLNWHGRRVRKPRGKCAARRLCWLVLMPPASGLARVASRETHSRRPISDIQFCVRSATIFPAGTYVGRVALPDRNRLPFRGVSSLDLPAGFGLPAFSKFHGNRRDRGQQVCGYVHRRSRVSAAPARSPLQFPLRRSLVRPAAAPALIPARMASAGSDPRSRRAGGRPSFQLCKS